MSVSAARRSWLGLTNKRLRKSKRSSVYYLYSAQGALIRHGRVPHRYLAGAMAQPVRSMLQSNGSYPPSTGLPPKPVGHSIKRQRKLSMHSQPWARSGLPPQPFLPLRICLLLLPVRSPLRCESSTRRKATRSLQSPQGRRQVAVTAPPASSLAPVPFRAFARPSPLQPLPPAQHRCSSPRASTSGWLGGVIRLLPVVLMA